MKKVEVKYRNGETHCTFLFNHGSHDPSGEKICETPPNINIGYNGREKEVQFDWLINEFDRECFTTFQMGMSVVFESGTYFQKLSDFQTFFMWNYENYNVGKTGLDILNIPKNILNSNKGVYFYVYERTVYVFYIVEITSYQKDLLDKLFNVAYR